MRDSCTILHQSGTKQKEGLHPSLRDEVCPVQGAADSERPGCAAPRSRRPGKGNARQHLGTDAIGACGDEMHTDLSPVGMADDHHRISHLVEDRGDRGGIVRRAPRAEWKWRGAESGEVEGDGIEAIEHGIEVAVRSLPSV